MDTISALFHIILHLDQFISTYINILGDWTYLLLFLVIFCETGLVVTPFLPGDSLLFALGLTGAATSLNVHVLAPILVAAAVCGDSCNYFLGRMVGKRIFKDDAKILKTAHLLKAQEFFNKYGAAAIILARFTPLVRTFMPFTAGMARMRYPKFVLMGILGAFIWVYSIVYLAFFFSNNAFVKKYFGLFVILIIVVSLIPPTISFIKAFKNKLSNKI
ncbi:VTT domain-containing protein [Francisella philomiragia]|uniref:VTT domain-containing protein n=1 Tax=Francisella philomiragia TaxID=28110 RepID=UPI0019035ADD|nr:VTT domain-containing protein [Francisella philomiragia]MBK2106431.1 VTT domain-containing protein [Francisella philomiragia]MBK2297252.1 VTT domain-containing protein [Francisella philomiragia]MBK2340634.1 VTT domain-containing protein [Francisella philomiragia]